MAHGGRHDGPTALILSRQNLPVLEGTGRRDDGRARGALRARRRRRRRRPTSCSSAPAARCRSASMPPPTAGRARASPSASCRCRAGSCSRRRTTAYQRRRAAGRRPDAGGRGRRHHSAGSGWADDVGRHRPLRRVGAGSRSPRASLGFTPVHVAETGRERSPDRKGPRSHDSASTTSTHEHGQSPGSTTSSAATSPSGELAKRGSINGIRGLTSNPTILQKAIAGAADYDEQFKGARRRLTACARRLLGTCHSRHRRDALGGGGDLLPDRFGRLIRSLQVSSRLGSAPAVSRVRGRAPPRPTRSHRPTVARLVERRDVEGAPLMS